jgi:alanyl-tRNA synthetase
VVVVGVLTNPPSVLLASSEDSGIDAGRILKERLTAAGGRGGGSPRLAQGSVPDAAALELVVASLVSRGASS